MGALARPFEYQCSRNGILIPRVISLVRKRDLRPPCVEHRATPLLCLVQQQRCARTLDHQWSFPYTVHCTVDIPMRCLVRQQLYA